MQAIDFHTHIFPDAMAQKTVQYLSEKTDMPFFANGTLLQLQAQMRQAEISLSVVLPVLTRPQSFEGVLQFAQQINEGYFKGEHNVYSFGCIHPDCEDVRGKMALMKQKGFRGVKIHPDYQTTDIDDERNLAILQAAADEDLIVVAHAGVDPGYSQSPRCTPQRIARALDRIKGEGKFVFAHMGGVNQYEEVLRYTAGRNVYFDTAYVIDKIDATTFHAIKNAHGIDRLLFASDTPWVGAVTAKRALLSMNLTPEEEEKILFTNALKLLGEDVVFRKESR